LVESISKIPDSIKRSVFYQEVANLMGIEEQILITEGNKISLKKINDAEKDRQRQNRIKPQQVGDLDILVERQNTSPSIPAERTETQRSAISYQEEECIRLLVCYGTHILDRNVVDNIDFTLTDYVFNEIRDMVFETPTYQKILMVFRDFYENHQVPDTSHFTSHQDVEIQQQVINWLSTPHQLSENWVKKDIYIPSETDKLADLAYTNVLRLKKTRYEADMKNLSNQLIDAQSYEEQDQILVKMMQLKEVIKKIAGLLGTVVQG
jgi:DNA primase